MRLNIYHANTTATATTNTIALLGKQNQPDSEHIILAPDRFTLSQEREIYQQLELDGSFNIEVMSFLRFANSIVKQEKGFLSEAGTIMLMRKVLQENKGKFSYFSKLNMSYGFSKDMLEVISTLRHSGISHTMLLEKVNELYKLNKEKLRDIALIYSLYEQALKEKYTDTLQKYEKLINLIRTSDMVPNMHFYVMGFYMFSDIQMQIIKELCLAAKSVTITAITDSGGANKEIFNSKQIEQLLLFAKEHKIAYESKYFFQKLAAPFDIVNKELFALTDVRLNKEQERQSAVSIFKRNNPYEEIKIVAREITYLIKEGMRYKDMALICCQEEYKRCIADIFNRCNIPYFIDDRYTADQSMDGRFIFYIMEVILYQYRMSDVLKLIKHPYFDATRNEADMFENYCLKYNINHSIFTQPFIIEHDNIDKIERVRKKLVHLIDQVNKGSVCEINNSIMTILENKPNQEQTYEQGEVQEDLLYTASIQSQEKIGNLLKEMTSIFEDEHIDIHEYYNILREGISSLEIALIPQFIDCVFVGNTTESRFSDIKNLFIVGANEGFFPLKSGDKVILTYSDIVYLKNHNLKIYPDPLEMNRLEKLLIIDLFSKCQRLYVSCSDYSITGERMLLGEVIKELSYILKLPIKDKIKHNFSAEESLLYNLICLENAYYEYMAGGIPLSYRASINRYLKKNGYSTEMVYDADDIEYNFSEYMFLKDASNAYTTKVSQLESYFRCPFRHFLNYGLKLKERDIAGLKVVDIGNIIHEILEVYFSSNLNRLRDLSSKQIYLESIKAIDKVLNKPKIQNMSSGYTNQNTLLSIKDECIYVIQSLMSKINNSSFTPKYIELVFDDNKQFKSLKIPTAYGDFKLRGKIDRVDMYGKKVAIIDYKTGSANDTELKYIYYGKKIQLYVYMNIFTNSGFQPAGAFYLPIKDGYRSSRERFRFHGQVDKCNETIKAFDNLLFDESRHDGTSIASEILNLNAKRRKNGVQVNLRDSMISKDNFMDIIQYVKALIKGAIEEICTGYHKKSPIKNECEYCQYKNHCDMTQVLERQIANISIDTISRLGR